MRNIPAIFLLVPLWAAVTCSGTYPAACPGTCTVASAGILAEISACGTEAPERPGVDHRVELLSIVFRLAGKPEYTVETFELYTDRIYGHFGSYRNHELIEFTRSVMYEDGIGYDAVMSMAVSLDDSLNFKKDISGSSLDSRWSDANREKFLTLLRRFYEDSDAARFFEENSELYAVAGERFLPIYEKLDREWFASFFGEPPRDKFIVITGLGNGRHSYGPGISYTDGRREIYAVMGAWDTDGAGMVQFDEEEFFPVMVHEFAHSFVNPLTADNLAVFRSSGEQLLQLLGERMRRQAYGDWPTILNEALVRASVVKYMQDHEYGDDAVSRELALHKSRGFLWIEELIGELNEYDRRRDIYPSLKDYVPRLAEVYAGYVKAVRKAIREDRKRDGSTPKVLSINEFRNGATDVDADITTTITLNFDRPLSGRGYSIYVGSKGKEAFPKIVNINYADGNRSVVLNVELERGREYQMVFKGEKFESTAGVPMKDYTVSFSTAP